MGLYDDEKIIHFNILYCSVLPSVNVLYLKTIINPQMKNKTLNFFGLLLMLSVLFVSCKKTVYIIKSDELAGDWIETPQASITRTLHFETDGKFSTKISSADGSVAVTLNGKYAIKGDSLKVNILERLSKDDSGQIVKTTGNSVYFEKGTFSVQNSQLTINHITYPADAPVATKSRYNRILED